MFPPVLSTPLSNRYQVRLGSPPRSFLFPCRICLNFFSFLPFSSPSLPCRFFSFSPGPFRCFSFIGPKGGASILLKILSLSPPSYYGRALFPPLQSPSHVLRFRTPALPQNEPRPRSFFSLVPQNQRPVNTSLYFSASLDFLFVGTSFVPDTWRT